MVQELSLSSGEVRLNNFYDNKKRPLITQGTFQDITDSYKKEEKLTENEEKLRETLELGKSYNFKISIFEPEAQKMILSFVS